MRSQAPPYIECKCYPAPAWGLGQEFRERRDTGEVILVCKRCDGLWDHRVTDRIIESVMGPRRPDAGNSGAAAADLMPG